ncbi:MAG: bifunctional precorrin-2 dehydrogenase/sirohydrochlorin ferrochelatase [Acidobacteria bacterium]|nr:bifunctional precorrin-2 dehydrogenase/sirohydrochlorin ferrochelatase [Acidobacteriota bacterium]MBS1867257.1 bifunctional precorrin-2 dehydrogenase/sirohydrochlorin ferrochelatase [Acidobacteriota bacterium]
MSLFPMFARLEGRRVVVVGGGEIAASKIDGLLQAGAKVRVVSPSINATLAPLVRENKIEWHEKEFSPEDLGGAFLAIAATSVPSVNAAVYRSAEERGLLCNAVDDIENCHFYYGAVVQRGDLQIAISTNGKSPALAQRLRKELELQFGPEYESWLEWLGAAREVLRASGASQEQNKEVLHNLASREMFDRFLREANREPSTEGVE